MDYAPDDRFFRRLNPRFAFTASGPGQYRVTSAAFKAGRLGPDGRFEISVDAERLISLEEERGLAAKEHPGFGIGSVTYSDIVNAEAILRTTPTATNPAHHDILTTKAQARLLARSAIVIDWPTVPISVSGDY